MTSETCSAESTYSSRSFRLLRWVLTAMHHNQRIWWIAPLLWFAATLPAAAQLPLRVAIEQNVNQVKIGSSTDAALVDATGQAIQSIPAMNAVMAEVKDGQIGVNQLRASQFCLQPGADGLVFINDTWYRGFTCVVQSSGGLTAVNYVDLEAYLYSVVGAEMPASWHLEALKAQAVAARTYVLYQRQNSANAIFDVGNTTRWQVYGGVDKEAASTRAAVEATRGQVLTHGNQLINAVFHACAGGHTENVEDVWSNPLPYLRGVPSPDADIQDCQWTRSFNAQEFAQQIGYSGTISEITPAIDGQGRVVSLQIQGSTGGMTISGKDARSALGIRSTLFTLEPVLSRVAAAGGSIPTVPNSFNLVGRGYGHGIGLSQWGARVFAERGYNYQQILSHYYHGVALSVIEVVD
jgi:stage II sporulation protein D